ncbi:hypothetical protein PS723_00910 [Pseudomonas fluorescens]|uniref:Uncharacterized protein n=1 Tax=Pseudomonas fluorescens TaxID=294 RepID=A0A5E7AQ77_PSEFL|nr:hypothetical protein PS723_00910 [Pseudomonas fluorescens]
MVFASTLFETLASLVYTPSSGAETSAHTGTAHLPALSIPVDSFFGTAPMDPGAATAATAPSKPSL